MNYFTQALGPETVPSYLRARTAEGLRRAMRINATKQKGFVQYSSIQWVEAEKSWYAWFYISEKNLIEEVLKQPVSE